MRQRHKGNEQLAEHLQRGARTEWRAIGYASKMCSAALKGNGKKLVRSVKEERQRKEGRKEGGEEQRERNVY